MRDRIKELDWKIFRRVHQAALERFCDNVLKETQYFATDREASSHKRYLEIYKRVHERDDELAEQFNGMSQSKALLRLVGLRFRGLVTDAEFAEFSEELRTEVEQILRIGEMT